MVICCLWDCIVRQNTALRGMWQSILAPLLVYKREGRRERREDKEKGDDEEGNKIDLEKSSSQGPTSSH